MTELALRHLWRSASFDEQRCMRVPESMKSGAFNLQGIE
jgi:hypothetical protein